MKLLILFVMLLFTTELYAQATAPVKLIFLNECADLPPEAFKKATNLAEWEALTVMWECHNRTQASQRQETFEQVWRASYNVKLKKPVTICSIDPKQRGKYTGDFYNDDVDYIFGAWKSRATRKLGCDIDFANMPSCGNARRVLERLLRARR